MTDTQPEKGTLPTGTVIGGAYVIERFLARGGMGEVYVCRDAQLDRQVAVKLLHGALRRDSEIDARFQLEARVMSRVVHPNVVAIYAFGRHEDAWYIAMELVEGQGLDGLLGDQQRLDLQDAVSVARQVAGGLAEAHAHGIIHRDIKPANVLLRRMASGAAMAKVVDFGIARVFTGVQPEAQKEPPSSERGQPNDEVMLGTPAYMSPEQIQRQEVDGRADLYSLAVLTFQMLSGDLPIHRPSTQGTLIAHLMDPPNPLVVPGLAPNTLRAVEKVLHQALAKDRDDRPADVLAFARDLEVAAGLAEPDAQLALVLCPACRQPSRGGGGYCGFCGSAVPLISCPACGVERHGERYFCINCGTSLLGAARRSSPGGDEPVEAGLYSDEQSATAAVLVAQLDNLDSPNDASVAPEFAKGFISMIEREGGRPLALLGREAVAVFGLGGMREGEMEATLDAALALPRLLSRVARSSASSSLRIGVSLGRVSTHGLGLAWGTAMAAGDTVEAAREAAEACEGGQVVATDAACREARGAFKTVSVQGGLKRVLRHHDASQVMSAARDPAARTPLVGRNSELNALLALASRTRQEQTLHTVAVVGDEGAGKSRLTATLLGELERLGGPWQIDIARCSPIGFAVPFEPFVDILRVHSGGVEASRETILSRLGELLGVEDGQGDGDEPLSARRLSSLGRLMGLDAHDIGRVDAVRPASEVEQAGAFEAYTTFLRQLVKRGPLVLVLEDMQWAKTQTLDLLRHILRTCQDLPLLVLTLVRRDRAQEVLESLDLSPAQARTIDVPALTIQQTREVLLGRVGDVALSEELLRHLHEFSSGLPARLEEALDALADEGLLIRRGGRWRLGSGELVETSLERPLSEMVLRRVERLPPADRDLLTALASGRGVVPLDLLSAMLNRKIQRRDLLRVCQIGLAVELKTRHFKGQREFTLRQQRVSEILARATPVSLRETLHRRAAAWLMAWTGPRPPGFVATLAHHFLISGDEERAAEFLLRTARESMQAFATRDAFDAFSAAAELSRPASPGHDLDEQGQQTFVEALLGKAEVGVHIGHAEEAKAAAIEAERFAIGSEPFSRLARSRALIVLGEVLARSGHFSASIAAYDRATKCHSAGVRGLGWAAIATGRKALVLFRSGQHREAEVFALAALRRYGEAVPTPDVLNGLGRLHTLLGHLASRRGETTRGREHYLQARTNCERAGDPVGVNVALLSLGNAAYRAQDLETAGAMYREAVKACLSIDYVLGVATARTNLGNVLLDQGKPGEALQELYPAEQAMRRAGSQDTLPETLRLIALCRLETGNLVGAVSAAQDSLELARASEDPAMERAAGAVLAQAEARSRDSDLVATRVE